MDLKISNGKFVVGGAGKGFGRAIAKAIANEGGEVFAISRSEEPLVELKKMFPKNIITHSGDIYSDETHDVIIDYMKNNEVNGMVFNGGGPPAGGVFDVDMNDWENAWKSVVKWKIDLTRKIIPFLMKNKYGRLVFIESISVKQPVENLVLSNALRPAVVGFVSTLAAEVASFGITANILAPGYHATDAMKRLFIKKSEVDNITVEEAKEIFEKEIPVGEMGKPEEMASLALWLLSPLSRYVTGQTITHDGGMVKSLFG